MIFLDHLINGLSLGSIYAIIALGYTMVYGIAKMLNFAHGDVIMIGAYIAFCGLQYLGIPPVLAILLAMLFCTLLGVTIEGFAYRPLRQATSLAVLITAIGMSYLLQNVALMIWGANPKSFPTTFINSGNIRLGQLNISSATLITILANVVIMVTLTLFTSRTKLGKAMRCVSEDRGAAELMGINVNRTISLTFAIGSALAAIAGVLLCSSYPILQPTTGSMPGIKAFTAAVFGGIGSIPGAMLGGILLGVIEIFGKAYISTELGDAIVFAVLIIVLLVKPAGLLGKPMREKVRGEETDQSKPQTPHLQPDHFCPGYRRISDSPEYDRGKGHQPVPERTAGTDLLLDYHGCFTQPGHRFFRRAEPGPCRFYEHRRLYRCDCQRMASGCV